MKLIVKKETDGYITRPFLNPLRKAVMNRKKEESEKFPTLPAFLLWILYVQSKRLASPVSNNQDIVIRDFIAFARLSCSPTHNSQALATLS